MLHMRTWEKDESLVTKEARERISSHHFFSVLLSKSAAVLLTLARVFRAKLQALRGHNFFTIYLQYLL